MKKTLLIAIVSVLLVGCGADHYLKEHQEHVDKVKRRPPGKVEPVPEFKTFDKFAYGAEKLRSPFTVKQQKNSTRNRPDMNRPKEPLEAYPLDALKMVGILHQGREQWGLVLAPDKVIYRVKLGSYMGKDYGKVVRITENEILLRETIPDAAGGWQERNISIKLSSE